MQRSRRTLSGHPGRRGGPKPPSPTAGMAPATRPGPRADGGRKAPAVHPRPPSPHVPGSGAVPHARLGIVRPWPERRCPHAAVQDHAPHRATTCRLRMAPPRLFVGQSAFANDCRPKRPCPSPPFTSGAPEWSLRWLRDCMGAAGKMPNETRYPFIGRIVLCTNPLRTQRDVISQFIRFRTSRDTVTWSVFYG